LQAPEFSAINARYKIYKKIPLFLMRCKPYFILGGNMAQNSSVSPLRSPKGRQIGNLGARGCHFHNHSAPDFYGTAAPSGGSIRVRRGLITGEKPNKR
jgi:hypothetical protein